MKTKMMRLVILLLGSTLMSQFLIVQSVKAVNYGKTVEVSQTREVTIDELDVNTFPNSNNTLTRICVKNGVKFSINLNSIANFSGISDLSGGNLIENGKKIEMVQAGPASFVYSVQNAGSPPQNYRVVMDVNYYGILQYAGADAPATLDVTASNQDDVLSVPAGKFPGIVWFNSSGEELTNVPRGTEAVSLSDLLLSNNTSFKVMLRDGTSNELPSGIGGGESWCEFTLVDKRTPTQYQVSLSANPSQGGSVQGAGSFNENSSVTISATANSGWRFVRWTESGSEVSTSASFTFQVTSNRNLVAQFEQIPVTTYTISLSANPSQGGSVQGAGSFNENSSVTISATANSGWRFVRWTESGSEVSTSASFTFQVTSNRNLVAQFERIPTPTPQPKRHQVTISKTGEGSLSLSVDGIAIKSGDLVEAGKVVKITTHPSAGWETKNVEIKTVSGKEVVISKDSSFIMPNEAVAVLIKFGTVSNENIPGFEAYASGEIVHLNLPAKEIIRIYSLNGSLLGVYHLGEGAHTLLPSQRGIMIIQGSTGWSRKVILR